MDSQTAWTIISTLATTLSLVVAAAFRYLLAENRDLKTALKDANESAKATNAINAQLAAMVPALIADRQPPKSSSSRAGGG